MPAMLAGQWTILWVARISILPEDSCYPEKTLNLKMTEFTLLVAFTSVATYCHDCPLRNEQDSQWTPYVCNTCVPTFYFLPIHHYPPPGFTTLSNIPYWASLNHPLPVLSTARTLVFQSHPAYRFPPLGKYSLALSSNTNVSEHCWRKWQNYLNNCSERNTCICPWSTFCSSIHHFLSSLHHLFFF